MLEVTNMKIKKFAQSKNDVVAVVTMELENCIIIHGIKIVQLKDRKLLSFPSRKVFNEEQQKYVYTDVVHPTNTEFRKYLEKIIFEFYENSCTGGSNE